MYFKVIKMRFVLLCICVFLRGTLCVQNNTCTKERAPDIIGGYLWTCTLTTNDDISEIPTNATAMSLKLAKGFNFTDSTTTLPQLPNLEYLTVDVTFLMYFPPTLFSLVPNLRHMTLTRDSTSGEEYENYDLLSGYFMGLSSLEQLTLHDLNIYTLQPGAFNGLENLKILDLSLNFIQNIPANTFSGCPNLVTLKLQRNFIDYHGNAGLNEDSFAGLHQLEWLNLDMNYIKVFKKSWLKGLPKLQAIMLKKNQISSIDDDAFVGLPYLYYIMLSGNQLTEIPIHALGKLNDLRILDLSENKITAVYDHTFNASHKIEFLYLRGNQINAIESFAFYGMTSLLEIHLSQNKIVNITNSPFQGLSEVTRLDVSHNSISEISTDAFNGLEKLVILQLNGNKLLTIEDGTFENLSKLSELYIEDNLWNCTCDIYWLLEWIMDNDWVSTESKLYQTQCVYPEPYVGHTFLQMLQPGKLDHCAPVFTTMAVNPAMESRAEEALTNTEKVLVIVGAFGFAFVIVVAVVLGMYCRHKRIKIWNVKKSPQSSEVRRNEELVYKARRKTPSFYMDLEAGHLEHLWDMKKDKSPTETANRSISIMAYSNPALERSMVEQPPHQSNSDLDSPTETKSCLSDIIVDDRKYERQYRLDSNHDTDLDSIEMAPVHGKVSAQNSRQSINKAEVPYHRSQSEGYSYSTQSTLDTNRPIPKQNGTLPIHSQLSLQEGKMHDPPIYSQLSLQEPPIDLSKYIITNATSTESLGCSNKSNSCTNLTGSNLSLGYQTGSFGNVSTEPTGRRKKSDSSSNHRKCNSLDNRLNLSQHDHVTVPNEACKQKHVVVGDIGSNNTKDGSTNNLDSGVSDMTTDSSSNQELSNEMPSQEIHQSSLNDVKGCKETSLVDSHPRINIIEQV